MFEERRMKTCPPERNAASEIPGWKSPKFTFEAAAGNEKLPSDLRPCAVPQYTEREKPLALLAPTSNLVNCAEVPRSPPARVVIAPARLIVCGAAKFPLPSPGKRYRALPPLAATIRS